MEMVFISSTRPESPLNLEDSLAQRPWETSSALLCAIRDATLALYLKEHRSLLLGSFKALEVQESLFRSVLGKLTFDWIPTAKEERIIQAACHGLYPIDEIEGAFYHYGGLYGIVALAIVFRDTYSILKQWQAIEVAPARQWLVSNVSQLFSSQKNYWISKFIPIEPRKPYTLQYLGHHPKRRNPVVPHVRSPLFYQGGEDVLCPYFPRRYRQPQEGHGSQRASCQQRPTPTSIPSPEEVLDNKRPRCAQRNAQFQQSLPSLSSIAFPPKQDLPQHQQLQEKYHTGRASSSTQQCITTPASNTSSSGQDLNLLGNFLDAVDPRLKERSFEKRKHRWSPTPTSFKRLKTNHTPTRVEAVEATPSNGLTVMLSRAILLPWSEQGVLCEVTPHNAGLHRPLASKISGEQPPEQLQVALAHQKGTLLRKGFVSGRSSVPHSPSPPQALLVSEEMFYNTKGYFENTCRDMNFDDHGTLLTLNDAKLQNDLNDFDSYCFTATMLQEKGFHVEFRRTLSKAFALVEQIIRAEHPRTLAYFLEVFIHLIQSKLPEVTSSLRAFIKEIAAKVTQRGHPWGQICQLLGELDLETLGQAMAQVWKCTTDTFDSELGAFSRFAVSVRLDYIKRVYGTTDYNEEERLLRELLAQLGPIPGPPTPRVMLNLAHNLNRQGRHDEAEEIALEVFSLLQDNEMYAMRIVERIESLKIISYSQFKQGNTQAEQTRQEAIRIIVDHWGIQHSWVLEFKTVLEGWLRAWGREEDANILQGEIEALMGKDEIDDEQLDGSQGLLRRHRKKP